MSLRAVVLDMGGVLLDMGPAGGLPFGELEREGRDRLLSRVAGAGIGEPELESLFFGPWLAGHAERRARGREEGVTTHLARLAAAAKADDPDQLLDAWFGPYGEWIPALPGAAEAMGELHRAGWLLALVSNVPLPGRLYRRALARHGLLAPFEATLFSHDEGSRKPSPVMLERALGRLGARPDVAVMVGDRRVEDVSSAHALGARGVWLESPFSEGPQPDARVRDLRELPALLERWRR